MTEILYHAYYHFLRDLGIDDEQSTSLSEYFTNSTLDEDVEKIKNYFENFDILDEYQETSPFLNEKEQKKEEKKVQELLLSTIFTYFGFFYIDIFVSFLYILFSSMSKNGGDVVKKKLDIVKENIENEIFCRCQDVSFEVATLSMHLIKKKE